MSLAMLIFIVIITGVIGHFLGRKKVLSSVDGKISQLHSLPGYYGTYVMTWVMLPAALLLIIWLLSAPSFIQNSITAEFPALQGSEGQAQTNLTFGTISSISEGFRLLSNDEVNQIAGDMSLLRPLLAEQGVALAGEGEKFMVDAAVRLIGLQDANQFWMNMSVIALAFICLIWAYSRLDKTFRARNKVERIMLGGLIAASSIAILTTVGIFLSMVSETGRFFASVPPMEFFFGTVWDPRFAGVGDAAAAGQFGLIPLLAGTLYIAFVAMIVAVPIGLFAAIYMAEYASPKLRSIAKPLLEVLAGIPTIVYGFFALVTVGPFLRDISVQIAGIATGEVANFIQAQSVLTAGLVMGIMLIPFVSSLSDDIITQVPKAMRDGSLGIGATRSETVRRVILPAALPGIVGALLLTGSRAIGETMIVVLAAGIAARLSINPFEPMTTVTVKIVSQLTGDLEFTSPQTLVAFALGMSLFFLTLALNVYALYIVRKYREQYE